MRTLLTFLPALALLTSPLLADDNAAITGRLQELGGKVTLKDGVINAVTFNDCSKLGEPEMEAIGKLISLKTLTLYGKCRILNDATVHHLKGLTQLENLSTEGAELGDAGLEGLTALVNLRSLSFFHLSLGNKAFTGRGFAHLKKIPNLQKLTAAGIYMGDEGFAAIAEITQLQDLRTWHTYQTQSANAHLARMPNLTGLQMGQRLPRRNADSTRAPVSLSDESLPIFATMTKLQSLNLGEAALSLDALRKLKALPSLKTLTLHDMELSEGDLEQLKKDLPTVKVTFEPMTSDKQRETLRKYLE